MTLPKLTRNLVYALLVSLALLALLLVLNAPAGIMNSRAVYQGF